VFNASFHRHWSPLYFAQVYTLYICRRQSRFSLSFLVMDHSTLVFDAFDVDLVVKVLANTAFSPFFTGMIPVFYYFHVGTLKNDTVVGSFCYFLLVSSLCESTVSFIHAGSQFLTIEDRVYQVVFARIPKPRKPFISNPTAGLE
jgi:hypothetical protein